MKNYEILGEIMQTIVNATLLNWRFSLTVREGYVSIKCVHPEKKLWCYIENTGSKKHLSLEDVLTELRNLINKE